MRKLIVKFTVMCRSDRGDYDGMGFDYYELLQAHKNYKQYITNIYLLTGQLQRQNLIRMKPSLYPFSLFLPPW